MSSARKMLKWAVTFLLLSGFGAIVMAAPFLTIPTDEPSDSTPMVLGVSLEQLDESPPATASAEEEFVTGPKLTLLGASVLPGTSSLIIDPQSSGVSCSLCDVPEPTSLNLVASGFLILVAWLGFSFRRRRSVGQLHLSQ